MLCSFPVLLFDCTVLSCSLESYYFLSNSVGYLSNSIMPLWVLLGPVHTYPEIFVSANFFMRIHLAYTRVRRIRSVYPEISVYALQSGNFCIRCVSGYVWTLLFVYFCIRWRHTIRIRSVWTQIFLYPHKKICGYKNLRIRVDGALFSFQSYYSLSNYVLPNPGLRLFGRRCPGDQ